MLLDKWKFLGIYEKPIILNIKTFEPLWIYYQEIKRKSIMKEYKIDITDIKNKLKYNNVFRKISLLKYQQ